MCNVIASWSNVMHEPPSLLVSYGFNAEPHAWPTPEFIAILSTVMTLHASWRHVRSITVKKQCQAKQNHWRWPAPWRPGGRGDCSQQSLAVPGTGGPGTELLAARVAIIIWSNVTLERKSHQEANVTWSKVTCACIQVSTGEVVARSLSEHQAKTTCD